MKSTLMKNLSKNLFNLILIFTLLIIGSIPLQANNSIQKLSGDSVTAEEINAFLDKQMVNHQIPGLSMSIINEGKVVYYKTKGYANIEKLKPVDGQTIFEGASLSKPLFAFFVMCFVEQGKLSLDKPLFEYLPYPDIAQDIKYKEITARMVLSHTSGFPNWRTDYPSKELFLKFKPGTGFEYSGEGYQYLAEVLAHIENTDAFGLEKLFNETVARPFGMINTQFMQTKQILKRKATPYKNSSPLIWSKANQDFGAAYSVHSEALDFSKWVIAILNESLLSAQTYAMYFSPQNVDIPADHQSRAFGLFDWTLGFSLFKIPDNFYYHGGNNYGFTSMVGLDREKKWAVVLFTNADQVTQFQIDLFMFLSQ